MPSVTTSTFRDFRIELGDGATPTENFAFIAGLTSKGVNFTTGTETSEVPDDSDENLPSWQEKDVVSIGATISGSGMWATQNHAILFNWWRSATPRNVRIRYFAALTGQPEFYQGPAVLTQLDHQADKGGRVRGTITIEFTRAPTLTNKP